ncbi:hypothetical protein H4R33_001701 [Dimargaris cristalligena]|uniref:Uncharacterized protein n=1 Tax=Dimargaris cristalligena TaxID=215637 RepID=A0A4P9ZR85_9FUNG|nr:hypothetical protein H4R33_001701 [Dimargaris cristalligena]RKP35162.1 hypothetical protein BJ085DRAFT_29656 [Dimargaris cristalligena]|eukprot:RKP35162.1 hypothetical protein BJ085DRAFT_29656 [Dimargaris cristalligena]
MALKCIQVNRFLGYFRIGNAIVFICLVDGMASALQLYISTVGAEYLNMSTSMWSLAMAIVGAVSILKRNSILLQIYALGMSTLMFAYIPVVTVLASHLSSVWGRIFVETNMRYSLMGYTFYAFGFGKPVNLKSSFAIYITLYSLYTAFMTYFCVCVWSLYRQLRQTEREEARRSQHPGFSSIYDYGGSGVGQVHFSPTHRSTLLGR